jgi:hypothetical protein
MLLNNIDIIYCPMQLRIRNALALYIFLRLIILRSMSWFSNVQRSGDHRALVRDLLLTPDITQERGVYIWMVTIYR